MAGFNRFKEGFFNGLGIGLGILVVLIGLVASIYAFVEPSSSPTGDYVIDWSSPLNSKINETNHLLTYEITSLSSNTGGTYNNRIPDESFSNDYTEVCFKSSTTYNDSHSGGESTSGGNCVPGDIGFVIEQNERGSGHWEDAKAGCLKDGMRLPEIFEYKFACDNAASLGLNTMTDDWEWASNIGLPIYATTYGVIAAVAGNSGCGYGNWGAVAKTDGTQYTGVYRCVK